MKVHKKLIALLAFSHLILAFSLSSCKKLIQIPQNAPNQIVTSQVFADSADAIAGVINIYANMDIAGLGATSSGITIYSGLSADELQYAAGGSVQYQYFVNTLSAGSTETFWNTVYEASAGGLYQVNACIEGLNASTGISSSLKNQLIGECEVVRAFNYFYLVNLYGGVPLVTTTNYNINAVLPRATTAAVYAQITSDLKDAQRRLKVAYPSPGHARPNLYTATALLARVYLYEGMWSNAKTSADSVINSGQYSLVSNLNQVFLDGSSEAIWQIPPVEKIVNASACDGVLFVPSSTKVVPNYPINQYLISAFETGDQREADWLGSNTVRGTKYYYSYKYKNYLRTANTTEEDHMIFRLAEQYLIRAEAEAENNDPGDAVSDLNIIRMRAGLQPATVTASSQTSDILAAIMHERQVELFCEWGNRWLDLKRTDSVQPVLAAEKGGVWLHDDHAALFPIPTSVLTVDQKLVQNPGY